jgi:hypothetical protein
MTLPPDQMVASKEYIAKLLLKLSHFVPAYSLQLNNPKIIRDWVDDLHSYGLTTGSFDDAFCRIRDTFKSFPSMAEFKNILGITVSDEQTVETLTTQIWDHLKGSGNLSIQASDAILILGGIQSLADMDITNERDRHSLRQRIRSVVSSLATATPERLRTKLRQPMSTPVKSRLEIIKAQSSDVIKDIGPIKYLSNGELDHDEFRNRVNSKRESWIPDDWWLDIRAEIINRSIPEWQNGPVTPKMMQSLRHEMKRIKQCTRF